jgi:DNA-binding response OmpR family regulator
LARVRILILEDDDDLRASLSDLMSLEGAESCVTAASLAEVQARADEVLGCALAIIDVNLGEGVPSGVDAYRWLRDHEFAGRVVILTGHATSVTLARQLALLADVPVLLKPSGVDQLRQLVRAPAGKP